MLIAVAGCVAQAEGEEIIARQPAVDMVVGPQSYHRLPEMIARVSREKGHALETDFPAEEKFDALAGRKRDHGRDRLPHRAGRLRQVLHLLRRALHARREYSRPVAQIEAEARRWWRRARARSRCSARTSMPIAAPAATAMPATLAHLIETLARIEGLDRLRYTTSHPRDMGDDLIAAHRDDPKADAVSASAGAIGFGSHSGGDEPPAHGGRLSAPCRSHPRRRGPISRCRPISSSASPARPTRISKPRWRWCAR